MELLFGRKRGESYLSPVKAPICPRDRELLGVEDLLGVLLGSSVVCMLQRGLSRGMGGIPRTHTYTHMPAHWLVLNVEVLERNVPCVCGVLVKAV